MTVRKLGELCKGEALARLRRQATANADLVAVARSALPEWLDAQEVTLEQLPGQAVKIHAPRATTLLLRQILPALKAQLRTRGIRKVEIVASAS